MVLIFVASLAVAALLSPGLSAATLMVSSTDDDGPGSLRQSIAAASSGDEIVFDPALAGQIIHLGSGEIVIDKDLIITGLGEALIIVSGPGTVNLHPEHRIFVIRPGVSARIASLRLVNGSTQQSPAGGGAILNEGSLTLDHCDLSDNFSSVGDGGAIFNRGALVVLDSSLSRNQIEDHGYGGGLFNAALGRVEVLRTTFEANTSYFGGGTAIGNAGYIAAEDCTIGGNRTFRGPGAIDNRSGATMHLRRSVVSHNYALGCCAGAGNDGLLSITDSTFVSNTFGTPFGAGGGINNSGTLLVTNSTFHGNGEDGYPGGHGGAIYNSRFGTVVLTNTTITGNYLGSAEYGGVAGLENAGTAVIGGSLIAGNYTPSGCYYTPQELLRTDLLGLVQSRGHNFAGRCTVVANPSTCAVSTACGGFVAQDSLDVAIEDLVESEPLPYFSWLGSHPRGLLADNGGPTPTIAPIPGSVLIDSIPQAECTDNNNVALTTDQRGTMRPQGPACDAGSVEFSQPRGTGFWTHQCSGLGYTQLTAAEMQALFEQVAEASPVFPECAPIGCDTLLPSPPLNDMRVKAERSLLALRLNMMTGRVTPGRPVDLAPLMSADEAGEACAEIESMVCDPDAVQSDLLTAKDAAEAINNQGEDMELVSPVSSATLLPGATRSFTLAVINMSANVRSYDVAITANWPVSLSASRIDALGPDQVALVTATLSVPWVTSGQSGEIRVTASDRSGPAPLSRTATIRILVNAPSGSPGGGKVRRLE